MTDPAQTKPDTDAVCSATADCCVVTVEGCASSNELRTNYCEQSDTGIPDANADGCYADWNDDQTEGEDGDCVYTPDNPCDSGGPETVRAIIIAPMYMENIYMYRVSLVFLPTPISPAGPPAGPGRPDPEPARGRAVERPAPVGHRARRPPPTGARCAPPSVIPSRLRQW